MPKALDLSGQKFNKLTAIERTTNSPFGSARWTCRCDCGNTATVVAASLKNNTIKSCGCLRKKGKGFSDREALGL